MVVIKFPCSLSFKDMEYLTNFSPFTHDCLTLICMNGWDPSEGLSSWLFITFVSQMDCLVSNKLQVHVVTYPLGEKVTASLSSVCPPVFIRNYMWGLNNIRDLNPFVKYRNWVRDSQFIETVNEEAQASRLAHTECDHTSCLCTGNEFKCKRRKII